MISNRRYWFLIFLILCVYISAIDVTLFENDSAQFAVMAMRMVQENDFLSLFKGTEEYLDKPHMHYWLAAASFKIFGIHDWAYRIPAILATFLGAYSCFGLGRLLYTSDTGKLAALIFLTSQTIVLSIIDVRTDAVLTGFTILAIWKLASYIQKGALSHLLFGAFAAGIAFSTKGQIAILAIGFPVLCHLAYTQKWNALLHWKSLIALLVFAITISPMLYAYYHQFDLHPEKIIRGQSDRSGIFFIFWQQSFERMSGTGMGKNSSDYFFFFHTFLWVFLPWSFVGVLAVFNQSKAFIKSKFKRTANNELLTLGGIVFIFITISFAQFKLPHYLNITMPLFAVLAAAYLMHIAQSKKAKTIKTLLGIQYFLGAIMFIACLLISYYVFKFHDFEKTIFLIMIFVLGIYYVMKKEAYFSRIITVSVFGSMMLNGVLHTHFYPNLLTYQGGSAMAKVVAREKVPVNNIYKISENHTWALDFYNQEPVKISSLETLNAKHDFWIYANQKQLNELQQQGFDWDVQYDVNHFRITRLQAKFMNPITRKKVLSKRFLVHIY